MLYSRYIYICINICMYKYMYICMYVCMYVCMSVCLCKCVYVCEYICVCTCIKHTHMLMLNKSDAANERFLDYGILEVHTGALIH